MGKSLLQLIGENSREQNLGKNIYLADDVIYSAYTPYANGLGEFVTVYDRPISVQESIPLTVIGDIYLNEVKDRNLNSPEEYERIRLYYNDANVIDMPSVAEVGEVAYFNLIPYNLYAQAEYVCEVIEAPIAPSEQRSNYQEYIATIRRNIEINGLSLVDIFLNNVDFEDTLLGQIGADTLRNHININLAFGLERDTIGRINTRLASLINGAPLFVKDFEISKPESGVGRALDFLTDIQGVTIPTSYLPDDVFGIERKENLDTVSRTELILRYTGKGQEVTLSNLANLNLYKPYIKGRHVTILGNYYAVLSDGYFSPVSTAPFNGIYINNTLNSSVYDDKLFNPESAEDLNGDILYTDDYGIKYISLNPQNDNLISDESSFDFSKDFQIEEVEWSPVSGKVFNPKSILGKTQKIIEELSDFAFLDMNTTRLKTIIAGKDLIISKADNTTAKNSFIADDGTEINKGDYFRVWTKNRKYSKLSRTLRHRGLDNGDTRSVLTDNGLINIAPTTRNRGNENEILYKKYMFSIENLAWADNLADLPLCEVGVGDALSGNRGRIMWFPPYDLNITENVSVNWNREEFIGRGEPIFTYNNTSRSATISFTMIVDHPAIVNKIRGEKSEIWERYFKGDKSVELEVDNLVKNRLTPKEQGLINKIKNYVEPSVKQVDGTIITPKQQENVKVEESEAQFQTVVDDRLLLGIFFPNESSEIPLASGLVELNSGYEGGGDTGLGYTYVNGKQKRSIEYLDETNFGLNKDFYSGKRDFLINTFKEVLARNPKKIRIKVFGNASAAVTSRISNFKIAELRAQSAMSWIQNKMNEYGIIELISPDITLEYNVYSLADQLDLASQTPTVEGDRGDIYQAKSARRAEVYLEATFEEEISTNSGETVSPTILEKEAEDAYAVDPALQPNPALALGEIDPELLDKLLYTECDFFDYLEVNESAIYKTISERIKYFHPAFHSMTPQGWNSRMNFLHQCTRQGPSIGRDGIDNNSNLAFGRPPVCILRIGDFYHTKMIIENLSINYFDSPTWDLNPEGIGVQPMFARISLSVQLLGGSSMTSPINRLQNALSFNFYANTEMYDARADSVIFENGVDSVIREDGEGNISYDVQRGTILDGIKLSSLVNATNSAVNKEIATQRLQSGIILNNQNTLISPAPTDAPSEINDVEDIIELKRLMNLPLTEEEKINLQIQAENIIGSQA